jgi:hypothetical protein
VLQQFYGCVLHVATEGDLLPIQHDLLVQLKHCAAQLVTVLRRNKRKTLKNHN